MKLSAAEEFGLLRSLVEWRRANGWTLERDDFTYISPDRKTEFWPGWGKELGDRMFVAYPQPEPGKPRERVIPPCLSVREAVDVLVVFGLLPVEFSSAWAAGRESAYTADGDARVPDAWRATCQRDTCTGEPAHLSGEHLDPRSPRYDGPDLAVGALNMGPRRAARALLAAGASVSDVIDLVEEIHRLNRSNAAIRVDKDRAVRAASERALDCVEHGEMIRHAEKQANFFAEQSDTNDRARVALVEVLYALKDAVSAMHGMPELPDASKIVASIAGYLDRASRSHESAWRRDEAKSRKKKAATS